MLAFVHKLKVNGVNLIRIVGGPVGEHKGQREIVGVVNDGSAGVGGGANVCLRNSVDAFEGLETGAESVTVILTFGAVKPEENGVYKHSFLSC